MGVKRAMVVFESGSNLPEDRIVNTWHFSPASGGLDISNALIAFYNSGTPNIASFLSGYAVRTANKSQIRVYDLSDPMPREPEVFTWTLGASGGGTPLPREVCACLSYFSDRNIKRQRGRIYLGPLTTTAVENGPSDQVLTTAFRGAVGGRATTLATFGPSAQWVVYSPTEAATSGAEYAGMPVTEGWVDDSIDIQRRRGAKAGTRTIWT